MAIFGRFTERAQRALASAQRAAAEMHQPYVGTEHILMGLLREGDVPPAIASLVTEEQVHELLSDGGDMALMGGSPRFELTPRAKKLLVLIGSKKALHYAVSNVTVSSRNTRLAERLRNLTE